MAAPPATTGASPAIEQSVVAAAVARGFITVDQVAEARRLREGLVAAGRPAEMLTIIAARFLNPEQREVMRKVYFDALAGTGVAPAVADVESTHLLDPPSLTAPRPAEVTPPDDGPTRRLGDGASVKPVSLLAPSQVSAFVPTARHDAPADGFAWRPAATGAGAPAFGDSPRSADSLGPGVAERTRAEPARPTATETKELAHKPRLGDTLAQPAPNAPAESIEGYEVRHELGRGGMGVVYAATRKATGEQVALKVLLAGKGASDEDVQRFQIEAKAAQRLDHPNIVRVIDSGKDPKGHWYMAMELVDGESLEARVRRDGPLEEREAARVILAMARALEAAHEQRVLHRDLKPHNVLMSTDGTPKLGDFGLAKVQGDQQKSLTTTGHGLMGTPGYMSPEQAGGERKRIDKRSDVYGLGATLYHLLTGSVPFDGDSLANVVVAVLQKAPVKPSVRRPGIGKAIETVCLKCLEKEPDDRYPDMGAMADDLERYLSDRSIAARPPSAVKKASRWANANQTVTLVVLGLVAAVTLAALGGWRMIVVAKENALLADAQAKAERDRLEQENRDALAKAEREKGEIRAAAEARARELEDQHAREQADAEARRKAEAAEKEARDQAAREAEERRLAARATTTPTTPTTTPPPTTPPPPTPTPPTPTPSPDATPAPTANWSQTVVDPWSGFEPAAADAKLHARAPAWWTTRFLQRVPAGALRLAHTIEAALAEAAARRVPLVVVAMKAASSLHDGLSDLFGTIDANAVPIVCQNVKTADDDARTYKKFVELHGDGAPCRMHPTITCAEHRAVKVALIDRRAFGLVVHPAAYDLAGDDKWRLLVMGSADGRTVRFVGYGYDETPNPGLEALVPGVAQHDLPAALPRMLAAPAGAIATDDLLALAAAANAIAPAELVRAHRAAKAVGRQQSQLAPWTREVESFLEARAAAMGAWAKGLPDREERLKRLRELLDDAELRTAFDRGRR